VKKRRAARLVVVPASALGWSRPTDYFLIDKNECHGPFPTDEAALRAARHKKGSFGYGNVAPDLTALFPKGGQSQQSRGRLRPL